MMASHNVLALPNEILLHIASFLQSKELITCTSVCDKLYSICSEYCLWRRFFVDIKSTSCPAGRLCHTGAVNKNKMYIYGGHITQPSSEYFHSVKQDLFEYDIDSRQWNEYTFETAPRRTEHTSAFYSDQMLVFGGYSGNGYENSVMAFDTKTKTWSQMVTNGEAPSARSAHTAVVVGHTMYIFGGWNGVHCMNDLHALDLTTSTWKLITPPTAASPRTNAQTLICSGDVPVARCSHGAVGVPATQGCSASNVMYVFGGYSIEGSSDSPSKGYLNDLHEFNFDTLTWRQIRPSGIPPTPRSRFRMVSHKESLYLFAGWNSAKHFSSLHRYNSHSNQWSEIHTDFDYDGIGQFSMIESNGIMYVFSGFSPNTGCRSNLFAYPLAPSEISQSP